MRRMLTAVAAAGVLSLSSIAPGFAASVTQPGETVGLPAGAPVPPGFYLLNTADWGCRDTEPDTCIGLTIPVLLWSTPWKILGGRLELVAAQPALEVGVDDSSFYQHSWYNPAALAFLAWDLGNNWGISYGIGAYFDVHGSLAWSDTSLNQRLAVSYTGGGWNLTANLIYMTHYDEITNRPQLSPCPAPLPARGCNPDALNLDLTATKKFGKWEFGAIGYASWDLTNPIPQYREQRQWAVGPLVGYDFGAVTLQAYYSQVVDQDNYGGADSRFWFRFAINLGDPFGPAAPEAMKKGY